MTRYKKWLFGSLVISAVSIALVTYLTFDSETVEALKRIRLEYILVAALLHIFSYVIWGLRTRVLCKALGHRIGILKVTEIVISSSFVAGITPSSAGGEFLRVHSLNRNKIPLGRATAIVVGERLLDAIFIFSCLPFALYVLGDIVSNYEFDAAFLVANSLVFVLLFCFVYGVWRPEKVKYLMRKLTDRLAPYIGKKTDAAVLHLMEQIDGEIDHFHDSVRVFFSEGRKGLLWGIVYTFIFWIVDFSLLILILMGLSRTPSIITAFAAQVLLAVIMIIPATPGASGVAELGAASIFSIFVDSSILGITVLAWRALTYHLNLLVGGLMSLKVIKDTEIVQKWIGDTAEPRRSA
ncbi:TPA: flippase-like domain-containing protein [Methanosarcina acetivorans]|uniref:Integral membrane protein n=2 Tax=Methanosarcina acetivorans TaxID=2214 RepID=Q8TL97_METAC|nr:flippase-like domain-containing protein [Methanosarcina acetivorans]AAM06515.1 conserved hypothetical protein [Methanosarcina acetivorans C2A]HIH93975.1 flippase-like domain-containing protein [Methanosarcina acetivorans]